MTGALRLGLADHFGWAIAVTASDDHAIVDRRRIELLEPGVASAPVHHEGKDLSDAATLELIATVRASIARAAAASFDELASAVPSPIVSVSLRAWPADFPDDIETRRRPPYEARADAVMYRHVVAEVAEMRGWAVHFYDAKAVESQAAAALGERAGEVLGGVRERLGPPWAKDHRVALAATVMAT